jgi:hypothetical protein
VRRDTIALLLAADAGRYTVRQLPVSAGAAAVLEVSGLDLDPVRLYLDDEWRITRQTYTTPGPEGRLVQVEEILSDYRDVDGIRVPFRAQLVRDGRPVLTRTLTRVTLNAPLDDTLFTRPR